MLMRTDPFRELDRLTQQVLGTAARPAAMPMDAYRHGDSFYICLDLPGIDPGSIDLTVEQNVLTVSAERAPVQADGAQMIVAERPSGTFTRQVFLGETLDTEKIADDYAAGVLTLTFPDPEDASVQADGAHMIAAERPSATVTRQVFLGETLDTENIAADYAAGVLTLTIPVHEAAKPRNIQVTSSDTKQAVTA